MVMLNKNKKVNTKKFSLKKKFSLAVSIGLLSLGGGQALYSEKAHAFITFDPNLFMENIEAILVKQEGWATIANIYNKTIQQNAKIFNLELALNANLSQIILNHRTTLSEDLHNLKVSMDYQSLPVPEACRKIALLLSDEKGKALTKATELEDIAQSKIPFSGGSASQNEIIEKNAERIKELVQHVDDSLDAEETPDILNPEFLMNANAYLSLTPYQKEMASRFVEILAPPTTEIASAQGENLRNEQELELMRNQALTAVPRSVLHRQIGLKESLSSSGEEGLSYLSALNEIDGYYWADSFGLNPEDSLLMKMSSDLDTYTPEVIRREEIASKAFQVNQQIAQYKENLIKEQLLATYLIAKLDNLNKIKLNK